MKRCTKCGEEKELSAFTADGRFKDGYRRNCNPCHGGLRFANFDFAGAKVCTVCGEEKELSEFTKQNQYRVGRLNPACRNCNRRRNEVYRNTEKGRRKKECNQLTRMYGITLEKKEEMISEQGGCCAICRGVLQSRFRSHVDHNHETNEVRAILCPKCNQGVYHLERRGFVAAAQAYLAHHESLPQTAP